MATTRQCRRHVWQPAIKLEYFLFKWYGNSMMHSNCYCQMVPNDWVCFSHTSSNCRRLRIYIIFHHFFFLLRFFHFPWNYVLGKVSFLTIILTCTPFLLLFFFLGSGAFVRSVIVVSKNKNYFRLIGSNIHEIHHYPLEKKIQSTWRMWHFRITWTLHIPGCYHRRPWNRIFTIFAQQIHRNSHQRHRYISQLVVIEQIKPDDANRVKYTKYIRF